MKLYELTGNYVQLMEMAEELDLEIFQDTLDSIQEGINDKADNIARLLRNIEGDIEALKLEEKRLNDRRRSLENKVLSIKSYLQNQLEGAGIEKVKSTYFTIAIRSNPPKVNVLDESKIPSNYMIAKYSLDKKTLKEALKNGEVIEGCELIQERGLTIR